MSNKRFKKNNSSYKGFSVDIDKAAGYKIVNIDCSKANNEDCHNFITCEETMCLADEFIGKLKSGNSLEELTNYTIKTVKDHYNNGDKLPEVVYNNIKRVVSNIHRVYKFLPDYAVAEEVLSIWTGFPISFKRISVSGFNRYFETVGMQYRLNH